MVQKDQPAAAAAGAKKDKQKVIGEAFDEAKLSLFLEAKSIPELPVAFNILLKAYRGLPPEGFETFLPLYVKAGHRLDATNHEGVTFAEYIADNQNQREYVDILNKARASL